MKFLGQDIIDFYNEKGWPFNGGDLYFEEAPFFQHTDGRIRFGDEYDEMSPVVDPAEKYDVTYGVLAWQGKGAVPDDFDDDLVRVMKKWKKRRTTVTLIIDVPNERVEEVRATLTALGLKLK